MSYILLFILAIVIILVVTVLLLPRSARDKVVGICEAAMGQGRKKQKNKEKIVNLLAEGGELSNADIRKALGVSSRTVVRYLNELEREGKVEQVGDAGHAVTYRLR